MIQKATEQKLSKVDYPITLDKFLETDIPPVEYVIKPVLPEKGRLLISAHQGSCKTFFILNLAIAIGSGICPYLDNIEIKKRKVLCILGEGSEAEMRRRLDKMALVEGIDRQNLFLSYEPCLNLHNGESENEDGIDRLKELIEASQAEILFLDPIGQFWSGNENANDEVKGLTNLFDNLIKDYQLGIVLSHHWRKPYQNSKSGGFMASGSYWWTGWTDGHITLQGDANNLTFSFAKIRSNEGGLKYSDFTSRLRECNLWLEYTGALGEKVTKDILIQLFDSFGSEKVKFVDMANRAKKERYCCRNTLEKAIKQSSLYAFEDLKANTLYVIRKEDR